MNARRLSKFKAFSLLSTANLAEGLKGTIYLNVGEPDFDTPKHIVIAAEKALREGHTHYTEDEGIPRLRRKIAENENKKIKADVSEGQVLVTSGATGALFAACMSLINPGDEVIIQNPSYPGHVRTVTIAQGRPVSAFLREERDFAIDIDALNDKITPKTKIMIISSPTNPTGTVFERKELEAVAEICMDNELVVISDEVYEKFVYDDAKFVSIAEIPGMEYRTVLVNSFSKTYAMTGWRVGYAVGPKEIINQMKKVSCTSNLCVNSIAQYAALAALEGPQGCVDVMVKEYAKRRRSVLENLYKIPGVKFVKPNGAFYVFPKIEGLKMSSSRFVRYLVKEARVLLSPGYPFFGSMGKSHVRLSYTTSLDNLEIAMERIKDAMQKLRI